MGRCDVHDFIGYIQMNFILNLQQNFYTILT